jgi:hypothetical protein
MSRLPDSQRNGLIEDFRNGIIDPNFEVIPNPKVNGKYTVRRRKVALPTGEVPKEEPKQEPKRPREDKPIDLLEETVTNERYNPIDDAELYVPNGMKQGQMFREM